MRRAKPGPLALGYDPVLDKLLKEAAVIDHLLTAQRALVRAHQAAEANHDKTVSGLVGALHPVMVEILTEALTPKAPSREGGEGEAVPGER